MYQKADLLVGGFRLVDITDVQDVDVLLELARLIRAGQAEGAFTCTPDLSIESVLKYRLSVKASTSGFYRVYGLISPEHRLVGYVDFALKAGRGEVLGIIVLPEYRRRHLGTALLVASEKTLVEWGVNVIETRISKSNEVSKKFFSRHGYFFTGKLEEYLDACGEKRVDEVWAKYV